MNKLPASSKRIINKVKEKVGDAPDIIIKNINFYNHTIYLLFSEALSDKVLINKFLLKYFLEADSPPEEDLLTYLETNIPAHKILKIDSYDELMYSLLSGFSIFIIDDYPLALAIETKASLDSGVLEAGSETVIKGPKDAFTENYQTNIGLVRKRIKTDTLWFNEITIGTRSQTKIAIMYLYDIANIKLVQKITKKIKKINIDSIMDSNYIIDLISENKRSLFPNYISTERPDRVTKELLEGKIGIIVENTPFAVIIPASFFDFFRTTEDLYKKTINANFTRITRFIAFFLAVLLPAVYIAIITYNHEAIPKDLILSFYSQREGVPFPTVVEAALMIIVFEILKEADTRIPNTIGSALSIVGALVLGEAAVNAGIVSAITVIVIATTAISGLIVYSFDLVNGIRIWTFIFIIFASLAGIFGILCSGLLFIIYMSSINSFGIPYLSPVAPFNIKNQDNAVIITNKGKFFKRDFLTAKKNLKRTKRHSK